MLYSSCVLLPVAAGGCLTALSTCRLPCDTGSADFQNFKCSFHLTSRSRGRSISVVETRKLSQPPRRTPRPHLLMCGIRASLPFQGVSSHLKSRFRRRNTHCCCTPGSCHGDLDGLQSFHGHSFSCTIFELVFSTPSHQLEKLHCKKVSCPKCSSPPPELIDTYQTSFKVLIGRSPSLRIPLMMIAIERSAGGRPS